MTARRWSALVLLFALIGGGMGLPIADALIYHSTPTSPAAHHTDQVAIGAPASKVHLQNCALVLSGLAGSGIAGTSPVVETGSSTTVVTRFTTPEVVLTQSDVSLGQSRAPPIA